MPRRVRAPAGVWKRRKATGKYEETRYFLPSFDPDFLFDIGSTTYWDLIYLISLIFYNVRFNMKKKKTMKNWIVWLPSCNCTQAIFLISLNTYFLIFLIFFGSKASLHVLYFVELPDIRFGRILYIEIIRTDSQSGWIFNLTLLKLSGRISYNLPT